LGSEAEFALSWAKLRNEFHKDLTVRAGGEKIFFRRGRQYLGSLKISDIKAIKVISPVYL